MHCICGCCLYLLKMLTVQQQHSRSKEYCVIKYLHDGVFVTTESLYGLVNVICKYAPSHHN